MICTACTVHHCLSYARSPVHMCTGYSICESASGMVHLYLIVSPVKLYCHFRFGALILYIKAIVWCSRVFPKKNIMHICESVYATTSINIFHSYSSFKVYLKFLKKGKKKCEVTFQDFVLGLKMRSPSSRHASGVAF